MATVARLRASAPGTSIVQELVRFDMQLMENPEISGIEYQQGTLAGCEVREYLLAVLACGEPAQSGRSAKQEPAEVTHSGRNRLSTVGIPGL
jgi:RRXRR protein